MRSFLALFVLLFGFHAANAQENLGSMGTGESYENIYVRKLSTDENSTSFVIWIKENVPAHLHENHSETIYVLGGNADMLLGEKTLEIKPGDFIFIPRGTVHAVTVTSSDPLKVLSVQAPEFFGKDRKMVKQ